MEKDIFDAVSVAQQVKLNIRYDIEDKSPKNVFDFIWKDAVSVLSEESPVCGCVFDDCEIEEDDGKIVIYTGHNSAFYLYKKGVDKYLTDRIRDEFGVNVPVAFKNKKATEEEQQDYKKKHENYERQLIESIMTEKATAETAKETAKAEEVKAGIENGIIMGKDPIKDEPIKIKNTGRPRAKR